MILEVVSFEIILTCLFGWNTNTVKQYNNTINYMNERGVRNASLQCINC